MPSLCDRASDVAIQAGDRGVKKRGLILRPEPMNPDKKIIWLEYALKNLKDRDVPLTEAVETLNSPDSVVESYQERKVLMRVFDDTALGQPMLIRVVIEEELDYITVVTVFKTSNAKMYLKKGQ